ncbi:polynucleotide adenylyltransferase PcnB [Candidatus Synchoanobacter obligatus]|uniref:Polynucleotide adenylyltransferase PcnB n=1 Tax=Candidatus Synchoanobacter obligatus TaxID=2919597 RepID=A0ABT1L6K4_9GAMM|nr:polynucleotide adenylyltransferase PcnB [Candidatus Synchoanobacter obligatus]MCP8352350.1 polynucleotide adenylyltransferase PcnB [Candidatus Synchoanobacter obligatus]
MMFLKKWLFGSKIKPVVYSKEAHSFQLKKVEKNAISVLKQLDTHGFQAYLVGGVIRDQLMDINSKDCDVVTNAKPEKIVSKIKRSIIIGRRFRIVHARFGRDFVEISTFRSNASSRQRKISATGIIRRDNIYGTIEEDVMRRDFTVNALYFRYKDHAILDFVGGLEDIANKRLKAIGDPMERFPEDPVRMLRAVRFAAKLNLNVDSNIVAAVAAHQHLLKEISGQRLYTEVIKLYYSGHAQEANRLLREWDIITVLIPQAANMKNNHAKQLWDLMAESADRRYLQGKKLSVVYLFACLFWPVFAKQMAKKRFRHFSQTIADDVLAKMLFEVPLKTREDISEVWRMQYQFREMDKAIASVLKSKRLRASYELLCQRAVIDPKLSDTALFWFEHING